MPRDDKVDLLQALAVTAELTGTTFSEAAARVMVQDLAAYPVNQVLGALVRCRRELKTRLTVAAIVERLDDGRPGPEEAWAMIPHDERSTVVWTDEMAEAFGVACGLLAHGDVIAARMAFRESYAASVVRARAEQRPVHWFPSLGQDPNTRAQPIEEAVRKGRLGYTHAAALLPAPSDALKLEAPAAPMPQEIRAQIAGFLKSSNVTPVRH